MKKHGKSESEKAAQKRRTRANKEKKYKSLLVKFPNDKHAKIWIDKMSWGTDSPNK